MPTANELGFKASNFYKGWYWGYSESTNTWNLADRYDAHGFLIRFNADIYRIDQCFEKVLSKKFDILC